MAIDIDDTISAASVARELTAIPPPPETEGQARGEGGLADHTEAYLSQYFASFAQALPPSGLYERILAEIEPPLLRACLAATSGNQLRAAELLGINRNTLRVKLRERNVRVWKGL
jgi:two-component system nitrogen regulation response regulator GlnG